jgi:basic membrane protein A
MFLEECGMVSKKKLGLGILALAVVAGGIGYAVTKEDSSKSSNFSLAMVSDAGGDISDHSFTQISWEGVEAWGKEHNLSKGKGGYDYFLSKTDADFDTNFQTAVQNNFSMIAGIGFNLQNAVEKSAKANPKVKYALVDSVANSKYKNIVSLMFNSEESSYLAGIAAAMQAKDENQTTVGFLGGMYGPVVGRFEYGFREGVASVDPSLKVEAQYAGTYSDASKGNIITKTMIANGTKVIFQVAGGTGNGAFTAAKAYNTQLKSSELAADKVWIIGVDIDQYAQGAYKTADGKKDNFTLTSSLTQVGNALKESANDAMKGNFKGGKVVYYGLKEKGVGVIYKNLDSAEKKALKAAEKELEDGKIKLTYTDQYATEH